MFQRTEMNLDSAKEKTFPGSGENKLITSWLYGADELTHPDFKDALKGSVDNSSMMWQDFTAGPGVHKPQFMRGEGNSVNPGWRKAYVRPAAELQWSGTDKAFLQKCQRDMLPMLESLKKLNPEMGTYGNEADREMPDLQKAFWGSNYPRLLEFKKKYDPTTVMWCKGCVGAENWERRSDGSLCKI